MSADQKIIKSDHGQFICNLRFSFRSDEHSGKVKSFMLDVLSPLITESDNVSSQLLDIVLINIVEPQKSSKKNAYHLAKDLIIKTNETMEQYIQQVIAWNEPIFSTKKSIFPSVYFIVLQPSIGAG